MQLINIDNKEQLNNFVGAEPHSQFIQSWEWGEFQQGVSGRVWRIGVEEEGKIIASAKLIEKILPMGKRYFYCGRGPVVSEKLHEEDEEKYDEALEMIFMETERIAKDEGAMFLRFDPIHKTHHSKYEIFQTHSVQPRQTLVLNIEKSEDEILKEMHQKTRYNINLAVKKGVSIVEADVSRFEEFWHLLDQTSGRDKFRPHGRNYYQAMLNISNNFLKLFFAEHENRPIAAGIFTFFGDTATYLHGGSANDNRDVMAPYLLQWHAIKLARQLGYKYYDFHGIDETNYPGVTRFKKGFGGKERDYRGTFDLVYDEGWYSVYKMIRKVRRTF